LPASRGGSIDAMTGAIDITSSRILVTGGSGFLGSRVVDRLRREGATDVVTARSSDFDLRDPEQIRALLRKTEPQAVIHGAAVVGGIGANMAEPGRFFYDNAVMGIHLIEEARLAGVEKFVCLGTVCAYPKYLPLPFREENLWDGYPEETNAPYGLAKKMLLVQLQAYRQQYDFQGIYLLPVNLYGPGDNADPKSSHVIPALIKKCLDAVAAGSDEIVCWGTGQASREFLYVDDAAEGIVAATQRYGGNEPVNIGSGQEVTIRELVETIAHLAGFTGRITWDTSKPDGQPRRCLDVSRAKEEFGFIASTPLADGLAETVEWYRARAHQ
jgi:GDP-L-fucose synthase